MTDFERNKARVTAEYEALINRKNIVSDSYNGIYDRYVYPVLTAAHAPIIWKYDMNPETNPYFMERLGINAVLNSGAIYLNGKYYLVARVEGNDRKSFFAVAESDSPVDGFRFWDFPVQLPDTEPEETNVYDMRHGKDFLISSPSHHSRETLYFTLSSLTESTHSTHVHRTILSKLAQAEEYASVFAKTSQTLLSAQKKLLSHQGSITQSQR